MNNEFDISCYSDNELDWWNAALDHCGDSLVLTETEAKEYCKKIGISPYVYPDVPIYEDVKYEIRVRKLEAEGMTRSDAQAVADAELMR